MVIPELDLKKLKVYKIAKKLEEDMKNDTVSAAKLKKYAQDLKQEKRIFDFVSKTDNLYSKTLLSDVFKLYGISSKSYLKMTMALAKNTMQNPKIVKITPVDAVEERQGQFLQYSFSMVVPGNFDEKAKHSVKELADMVKKDKAFVIGHTSKLVEENELLVSKEQIKDSNLYSLPVMDTLSSRKFKKAVIDDIKSGKLIDDYKKYLVAYTKTMSMITELAVKKVSDYKNEKKHNTLNCKQKNEDRQIKEYMALTK